MHASIRAALAAGVTTLTASALAFAPPPQPRAAQALSMQPLSIASEMVSAASFTAGSTRILPVTDPQALAALTAFTQPWPGTPSDAADPTDLATVTTADEPLEDPVALNAASDVIDTVYAFTRYWANYVSLELGPWLINWVPFGYLISDQIQIWYPSFVLPVVDSFVYDFLDPVVNDPLNLEAWAQGIGSMIETAVAGVRNGVTAEIQYILDFGWFPFPLPPLPSFPVPGAAGASAESADADVLLASVDEADAAGAVEDAVEDAEGGAAEAVEVDGDDIVAQKPADVSGEAVDDALVEEESVEEESVDVVDEESVEAVDDETDQVEETVDEESAEDGATTDDEPTDEDAPAGSDSGDDTSGSETE